MVLGWWQAWLYWAIFFGATLFITLYFLRRDPQLIERRLAAGPGAEQETSQRVIESASGLLFGGLLLVQRSTTALANFDPRTLRNSPTLVLTTSASFHRVLAL